MSILNIRGTSGSGKSTLVRLLCELMPGPRDCFYLEGRRQPLYYRYKVPNEERYVSVIGHYETPCGGCDTIQSLDKVYEIVTERHVAGDDVIYEGLLISAEVNRCAYLAKTAPLKVVALDIDLQVCLDSVNARRWAKNPERNGVNPKNTISKHKGTKSSVLRLAKLGVDVVACTNREEALAQARSYLRL